MLTRAMDADFLNLVANHPAVRPWLLGDGPADLAPLIADPRNVALVTEDGGFVFTAGRLGDFEVHTLFLPGAASPLLAAHAAAAFIFCNTDAMRIVTKCPHGNVRARALADAIGFRLLCSVEPWDCLVFDIDDWAMGLEVEADAAAATAATMIADAGYPAKADAWLARWQALALAPDAADDLELRKAA